MVYVKDSVLRTKKWTLSRLLSISNISLSRSSSQVPRIFPPNTPSFLYLEPRYLEILSISNEKFRSYCNYPGPISNFSLACYVIQSSYTASYKNRTFDCILEFHGNSNSMPMIRIKTSHAGEDHFSFSNSALQPMD